MSNLDFSDCRNSCFLRTHWHFELVLAAILLGGVLLRGWQANESLWLDELHTSWVVADAASDVASRAHAGNQSPVYFFNVWAVVQLFGHAAWTLRLTSLLSGTVLIAATAYLVRNWSGSIGSGLLAALLVALNRDCIFFAQEARPYALVQLSALLHAAIFVAMLTRPTAWRRAGFVLGAAWLFYLHYTAFLFLLAEAACLSILLLRNARITYRLPQAICDALLVAVMLVPASMHLQFIAQRRENWARIVHAWPPPYSLQVALLLFGVFPIAVVLWSNARHGERKTLPCNSVTVTWAACWFLVPILLAWLATLCDWAALCMVRYLVASIVGAIVFAALCHAMIRHRWYSVAFASVLFMSTLIANGIVPQMRHDGRVIGDRNEAWDEATRWLDLQLRHAPQPVFLCAGLLEDRELAHSNDRQLAQYCLFPLSGIHQIHAAHLEPLPTTAAIALTTEQQQRIARAQGLWLVVRAGPVTTERIAAALCRDLARVGSTAAVGEQRRFGMVAVLRIDVNGTR